MQWFRAYSLFVAGLLIGAFGVYFFGSTSGSWSTWFGTQSYDGWLPDKWLVVEQNVFDLSCKSETCESSCISKGISKTQCSTMCKQKCETFLASLSQEEHSAAEAKQDTTFLGQKVGTKTKASDEAKSRTAKAEVSINTAPYTQIIDSQRYNPKNCVALSAVTRCVELGGTEEKCIESLGKWNKYGYRNVCMDLEEQMAKRK